MNTTEHRLREALKTVGDTMGSEDVPPMRASVTRRSGMPRPVVPASTCAVALVLLGGTVGGIVVAKDGDGDGSVSSSGKEKTVSVFLCTKSSSRSNCKHADATPAEKGNIVASLKRIPQVREVDYESKLHANERFRNRFGRDDEWQTVEYDDIPDAGWIQVSDEGGAEAVRRAMSGMPGVDTVIVSEGGPPA